jgi:outer membrane protein
MKLLPKRDVMAGVSCPFFGRAVIPMSKELIMISTRFVVCLVFALVGPGSLAQQKNITIDQAKEIALVNNISVVQAQNNIDAAQSSVSAAYGRYLPTLSASGGWNRYQNDRPGTDPFFFGGVEIPGSSGFSVQNDFRAGLNLNYTIFDGFSREANLRSANANAVSIEHLSTRARQTVVFQVEQQYLNVLRTEQLVRVADENLKRDRRQLERITESNRVGALSLADVYRQQSQVAVDELAVITAQNNYAKANADLVALIGLDVSADYTFSDPSLTTSITQAEAEAMSGDHPRFSELSEKALASRPDYLSAREVLSSAESGVSGARGGFYPIITAGAGYGISGTEFSNISQNKSLNWGINFSWSIFDGFNTTQAVQSAAVSKRNAEVALIQAERDINVEVKKALLDHDAARKQYEVSQKGLVSAKEDLRIQEERYNLGAGTLLDLLTASAGYVNAEANTINATYDYIISRRYLEYVVGERRY